jgi:hypothetical protein
LTRRSVQSQAKNLVFLLDEYLSPSAVITLSFISIRVIDNARNEVRNEEGCGAINPCCSGIACCWSDRRSPAAEESRASSMPLKERLLFAATLYAAEPENAEIADWVNKKICVGFFRAH